MLKCLYVKMNKEMFKQEKKYKLKKSPSSNGFTLIELLVVIAIIGVLATIVMVSISDLRARARDDRRVADMKAIRDALAMYQVQRVAYPSLPAETIITGSDAFSAELISERLMQRVPVDPTNVSPYVYTYQSLSGDSSYVLNFCLETDYLKGYIQGCSNSVGP